MEQIPATGATPLPAGEFAWPRSCAVSSEGLAHPGSSRRKRSADAGLFRAPRRCVAPDPARESAHTSPGPRSRKSTMASSQSIATAPTPTPTSLRRRRRGGLTSESSEMRRTAALRCSWSPVGMIRNGPGTSSGFRASLQSAAAERSGSTSTSSGLSSAERRSGSCASGALIGFGGSARHVGPAQPPPGSHRLDRGAKAPSEGGCRPRSARRAGDVLSSKGRSRERTLTGRSYRRRRRKPRCTHGDHAAGELGGGAHVWQAERAGDEEATH